MFTSPNSRVTQSTFHQKKMFSFAIFLAIHGLRWYLKWHHGKIGRAPPSHAYHFVDRANEFLRYLGDVSGYDLFDEAILRDDSRLREALFQEVNRGWKNYEGAAMTRHIHPDWMAGVDMGMRSRIGRSLVHGEACGNGLLVGNGYRGGGSGQELCRKGCGVAETLDHIVFSCHGYSRQRAGIIHVCGRLGCVFNLRNLFTRKELLPLAEELLLGVFDE